MSLSNLLRRIAREQMGIKEGEYFDSSVFDAQAAAVKKYVEQLIDDSYGDIMYVVWMLDKDEDDGEE